MDNHFAEIDEHPSCLGISLYAPGPDVRFLLRIFGDGPGQCPQLALILPVAQNKIVGEYGLIADVEHQNIATFLVNNRINQLVG